MQHLILKHRVLGGYTQRSLAKKMNISQSYISKIESGNKTPTVDMLIKFAEAFNIPICELFPDELKTNCPYKIRATLGTIRT